MKELFFNDLTINGLLGEPELPFGAKKAIKNCGKLHCALLAHGGINYE